MSLCRDSTELFGNWLSKQQSSGWTLNVLCILMAKDLKHTVTDLQPLPVLSPWYHRWHVTANLTSFNCRLKQTQLVYAAISNVSLDFIVMTTKKYAV